MTDTTSYFLNIILISQFVVNVHTKVFYFIAKRNFSPMIAVEICGSEGVGTAALLGRQQVRGCVNTMQDHDYLMGAAFKTVHVSGKEEAYEHMQTVFGYTG